MTINGEISTGILFYSHKQAQYVESGLNSILYQNLSGNVELVIIDDASPDGTADEIELWLKNNAAAIKTKFKSVTFQSRRGEKPHGQTATLFEGLSKFESDYIFILEGDDEWILPTHISNMTSVLEEYRWLSACGSSWVSLSDSNLISGAFEKPKDLSFINSLWDSRRLLGSNFATLSAMGYRGSILREILPKIRLCSEVADLGLSIFVAQRGPIYWCEQVSLKWRYLPNSAWRKIPIKEQVKRSINMLREYAPLVDSEVGAILLAEATQREKAISLKSKFHYAFDHPDKAARILLRKARLLFFKFKDR